MREIKFRAWFELEKKMVSSENLIFEYDGREDEPFTFAFDDSDVFYDEENKKMMNGTMNFELMQCTGLKDKNDKEIYEGDILKFEHKEGYANELQVVTMDKWYWGTDEYAFYEMIERKYVFEVIGNIYENPGLLGGAGE